MSHLPNDNLYEQVKRIIQIDLDADSLFTEAEQIVAINFKFGIGVSPHRCY